MTGVFRPAARTALANFHAAKSGHTEIHQNQVGPKSEGLFQAGYPVGHQYWTKAFIFKHQPDRVPKALIVVDDQDRLHFWSYFNCRHSAQTTRNTYSVDVPSLVRLLVQRTEILPR